MSWLPWVAVARCYHGCAQVRVQGHVDAAEREASSAPTGIRPEAKSRPPRYPSNASDAGSVSSSVKSSRPMPYSRPVAKSRPVAPRGRSSVPPSNGRVGAPSIGHVLEEALQKAARQPHKARGKGGATTASVAAGPAARPPVLPSLGRLQLDESTAAADSPMSTTGTDPTVPEGSGVHLPAARGEADGPAATHADSSDEEGAHRPPSPEKPPAAPAAPPAPPFAPPQMQLLQGLGPLSAALPAVAVPAPRTTRVSDDDRKALQQAHREAQAAAEEERVAMEAHIKELLLNPDTSIYDILMVECVLQPDMPHDAGALRAAYLTLQDPNPWAKPWYCTLLWPKPCGGALVGFSLGPRLHQGLACLGGALVDTNPPRLTMCVSNLQNILCQ